MAEEMKSTTTQGKAVDPATPCAPPVDYRVFLDRKTHLGNQSGFSPLYMPEYVEICHKRIAQEVLNLFPDTTHHHD